MNLVLTLKFYFENAIELFELIKFEMKWEWG